MGSLLKKPKIVFILLTIVVFSTVVFIFSQTFNQLKTISVKAQIGTLELAVVQDKFTINGQETFLLGTSYFDAKDWNESDFQYLSDNGFNLIRIWLDWMGSYPTTVPWTEFDSFFENDATISTANQQELLNLVRAAKAHGIVVDVTIMQQRSFGGNFELRKKAVRSAADLLKAETNVFYDVMNEYSNRKTEPVRFPLTSDEVRQLIEAGHAVDSDAIFTSSFYEWVPIDLNKVSDAVNVGSVEALAIHLARNCEWGVDTGNRVEQLKNHLTSIGKNIPVYLQEPQRRYWNETDCSSFRGGETYNLPYPYKADFLTAVNRAVESGAAAWVFHSNASYLLNNSGLYDNFDDTEKDIVREIRYAAFGQIRTIDMFDSLDGSTIGEQMGGRFTSGGWQPTSVNDMLKYNLPSTIVNPGYVEVEVTNFDPLNQCSVAKSDFFAIYDASHGNLIEATSNDYSSRIIWRIGTDHSRDIRLRASPGLFGNIDNIASYNFDPSKTYKLRMEWDDNYVWWSIDNNILDKVPFGSLAQFSLDHIFLGRDNTTGDAFGTCPGPIYSNLHVYSYADTQQSQCVLADLNCDGSIDATDLNTLISDWGTLNSDFNNDLKTNTQDLGIMMSVWGEY